MNKKSFVILIIIVAFAAASIFAAFHLHAQASQTTNIPEEYESAFSAKEDIHKYNNQTLQHTKDKVGNLKVKTQQFDKNSNLLIEFFDKNGKTVDCTNLKYDRCGFNLSGKYFAPDSTSGRDPTTKSFSPNTDGSMSITPDELNALWGPTDIDNKNQEGKLKFTVSGYFSWIDTEKLKFNQVTFDQVKLDSNVKWDK